MCAELPVPTFKPATLRPLHKLARRLVAAGVASAGSCEVVPAKVPLVKLVESETGLSIDLCINSTNGAKNSEYVRASLQRHAALRPLILVC